MACNQIPVSVIAGVPLRNKGEVVLVEVVRVTTEGALVYEGAADEPVGLPNTVLAAAVADPVPPLAIGRRPDMSAVKTTAPNVGAPAALPCSTVVVVPSDPRADVA